MEQEYYCSNQIYNTLKNVKIRSPVKFNLCLKFLKKPRLSIFILLFQIWSCIDIVLKETLLSRKFCANSTILFQFKTKRSISSNIIPRPKISLIISYEFFLLQTFTPNIFWASMAGCNYTPGCTWPTGIFHFFWKITGLTEMTIRFLYFSFPKAQNNLFSSRITLKYVHTVKL